MCDYKNMSVISALISDNQGYLSRYEILTDGRDYYGAFGHKLTPANKKAQCLGWFKGVTVANIYHTQLGSEIWIPQR